MYRIPRRTKSECDQLCFSRARFLVPWPHDRYYCMVAILLHIQCPHDLESRMESGAVAESELAFAETVGTPGLYTVAHMSACGRPALLKSCVMILVVNSSA